MKKQRRISLETRAWLANALTAEEIKRWGSETIYALGKLFDGLAKQ